MLIVNHNNLCSGIMPEKVLFGFSGGKDSCLALNEIRQGGDYRVMGLLTTLTEDYRRISMHGVREELLDRQAQSIGCELEKVWIPPQAENDIYERRMLKALEKYKSLGVNRVVFGDIFLADIREYRERQLARAGMQGVFPIWGRDSAQLADQFVRLGFKGITCCVDGSQLDQSFVGNQMDESFFQRLPGTADPCGENGEFHSFVYDGPIFSQSLKVETGDILLRDERFYFCDLLLAGAGDG